MKLFGLELFNRHPKVLYDFAQFGLGVKAPQMELVTTQEELQETPGNNKKKKPGRKPVKIFITPKGLYMTKALNDNMFSIGIDSRYLEEQTSEFKEKLKLLPEVSKKKPETMYWNGVRFGREELLSMIERFENRKRISIWKDLLDKYPHTTNNLLSHVLKENSYLRCQKADTFIPDFPKEAIEAMKEYNEACEKLCGKKTNFYVIAEKEDFGERDKRRDPILLAQSPFGFFWQILGAWDKEIKYLDEL